MVQCDFFAKKRKKCRIFLKIVLTIDLVCDKILMFMCLKTARTSKKVAKKVFPVLRPTQADCSRKRIEISAGFLIKMFPAL